MVDLGQHNVPVTPRDGRPSADKMLDRVRRQAGAGARGRHRVYLGIAPGVGKTYTALDELAHTNAPGSQHEKRWQDVEDLLDAGITVISTVNIQHLESLADLVENITGVPVRERVPDRVLDGCDEVELIDMSPHALRQRMKHGNIYPPERAERALTQFFREGNLIALREMALRKVAQVCEQDLEEYMHQHQIDAAWSAGERVMVCVDDQPQAQNLIPRA